MERRDIQSKGYCTLWRRDVKPPAMPRKVAIIAVIFKNIKRHKSMSFYILASADNSHHFLYSFLSLSIMLLTFHHVLPCELGFTQYLHLLLSFLLINTMAILNVFRCPLLRISNIKWASTSKNTSRKGRLIECPER